VALPPPEINLRKTFNRRQSLADVFYVFQVGAMWIPADHDLWRGLMRVATEKSGNAKRPPPALKTKNLKRPERPLPPVL
jgi:hypothetical protein